MFKHPACSYPDHKESRTTAAGGCQRHGTTLRRAGVKLTFIGTAGPNSPFRGSNGPPYAGFMNDIKQELLKKRDELVQRLNDITRDVRHEDNPLSGDWEEQAVQREHDEVIDALGNEARRELEQIKQALVRIENGDYSYCSDCGEEIQKARLELLPYTSLCVQCAEKHEAAR